MRKILSFLLLIGLFAWGDSPLLSQEEKKPAFTTAEAQKQEDYFPPYNPRGRRDPFRDLVAGRDVREKALIGGVPQMSVDDVNLIGIVEAEGKYTAIINGPQGFPYFIKVGQKFADGFVLSIKEFRVVFRKTQQRGIPLRQPKDIVKEIKPEER
jgi:Tfp pilus assembly protein PilP